jgi:hypothetical protein
MHRFEGTVGRLTDPLQVVRAGLALRRARFLNQTSGGPTRGVAAGMISRGLLPNSLRCLL